jgi:hypothetical protein
LIKGGEVGEVKEMLSSNRTLHWTQGVRPVSVGDVGATRVWRRTLARSCDLTHRGVSAVSMSYSDVS